MSKYNDFIFKDYQFEKDSGVLKLFYGYDENLNFCETYRFNFQFKSYDEAVLDRACQLLFFMAGVSYYKMYLAPHIKVEAGQIDQAIANFLGKTYQRGLGEFFYVNKLDPRQTITFPVTTDSLPSLTAQLDNGQLVGLGGGKDSLVSVELLRDQPKIATWSVNHRSQLEPLVERVGLDHFWVEREWDPQIQELNKQDALNGHIPISAVLACVGNIVAILSGYQDAVVSNESSASEPTLNWQGVDINHQYSKSLQFEQDFQQLLQHLYGESLRYYSFLRPLSELRIAEIFAKVGFAKYQDVFSSCNRAFTHGQTHLFWCGECPKCAFIFLVLTPFVDQSGLTKLWDGKNLLLDPSLESLYRQLLGIQGDKPFECVGEIKEARAAMRLAQKTYPELAKYEFYLPDDYDFRAWSAQSMPPAIFEILKAKLD